MSGDNLVILALTSSQTCCSSLLNVASKAFLVLPGTVEVAVSCPEDVEGAALVAAC